MAKTLVQIRQQIQKLEQQAESIRAKEVAGVVSRIQAAIGFYGLTASDLFQHEPKESVRSSGRSVVGAKKPAKKQAAARFRDPATGKTWTGHGKRPGWYVAAMESEVRPEDLAIKP